MTQHERRLLEAALGQVGGLSVRKAVERLFELGMIDRAACERQAIAAEVDRLTDGGLGRCEALHRAARTCCCSYEKARGSYYYQIKIHRK